MDKRQIKSRAAIYRAFGECLKEAPYSQITVEDILKRSSVSRSTFYAHFKTKDDMVDSLIENIFHHVFSHALHQESTHDFSNESVLDYPHLFTHVLYHLRDEQELISVLFQSACRDRILEKLRENILPLVSRCVKDDVFPKKDVPEQMQIRHIAESFIVLVNYWFEQGCDTSPEETTERFFALV